MGGPPAWAMVEVKPATAPSATPSNRGGRAQLERRRQCAPQQLVERERQRDQADADLQDPLLFDEALEEQAAQHDADRRAGQQQPQVGAVEGAAVVTHREHVGDEQQRQQQRRSLDHRQHQRQQRGGRHADADADARLGDADQENRQPGKQPELQRMAEQGGHRRTLPPLGSYGVSSCRRYRFRWVNARSTAAPPNCLEITGAPSIVITTNSITPVGDRSASGR